MGPMIIESQSPEIRGQQPANFELDDGEKPTSAIAQREISNESPPYSAFSPAQKKWIIFIASLAGWFSTASSFIYFPAIPFLARDIKVSVENINLTVTSYLIASGIFPAVTGDAADRYGRRPVFVAGLCIYAVVNIGLAIQRSFACLLVLRMVQSAAISGTFSIVYGIIGDITTPANRGGYTGFVSIFLNTPPSVAPLISGLLLIRWNWPSIFWFLTISSSTVLITILIFLPETCRNIVGNGSSWPPVINLPSTKLLCASSQQEGIQRPEQKVRTGLPNPFSVLSLLKNRSTLVAVICYGIYYTIYSCLQASLSTVFVETYNISGLVAGLSYLPFGVACATSAFVAGKIIDMDYRKTAKARGMHVDQLRGDDVSKIPIEYIRLRTHKYYIAFCAPLVAGYGWSLQLKTHMALPLTLQFLIGFTMQPLFTSLNILLVDLHPDRSSSAQAANNLVRCEFAAIGLAVLEPMLRALGPGWCFVIFALIHSLTLPALWILGEKGLKWRY
ncbi:MFS general substrate transporter [Annulohypoxylon maeteangense]|uniref:MFS general substrate transporter n=1 Tax=Annulohypoxylon maeteangense TaxID=1927788 RepID=UPI0020088AA2|nr:MFS general substrate transporter [Annulohypoxylon maeteangense]KAI0886352.1 MFS general substrate transporter [Annulohypoxylon maeteangense]